MGRFRQAELWMLRISLIAPAVIFFISLWKMIEGEGWWAIWAMLLAILTQLFNLGNINLRLIRREEMLPGQKADSLVELDE
jgi:hypothetical protein